MSAIRLSEYLAQPWRQVGWVCGVASDATPDSGVVRLANFLIPISWGMSLWWYVVSCAVGGFGNGAGARRARR